MRDAASFGAGILDGTTARPRWFVHFCMLVFNVTNEVAFIAKHIPATVH